MAELFAILSGLILVVGGPPYLLDILKGKTKPQRTTWFIWSVQGLIAFGSQFQLGAHWSLLFAGLNAGGNLVVFLLSLKYGVGGDWKLVDCAALGIACIGLVVSLLVKAPAVALVGVILADFAGVIPTLHKTFKIPSSETSITWFALGTSSLLAVFSVGSWSWTLLLFPVYMAVANYAVLVAQYFGHVAHKKAT
jgi:hypothetical protein